MMTRSPATLLPAALLLAMVAAACSSPASDNGTAMTGTGEYDGVRNGAQAGAQAGAGAGAEAGGAPEPAATARVEAHYLGRWKGVEGMFLNVARREGGGVTLDMQWDLDHRGTFPGSVTAEGLRFTRDGRQKIAVPGSGDATGLKWLAGKADCLTVRPGEGYCRD